MRSHRCVRIRIKRLKKEAFELDITSLLDILVIMLIFLLKSYNSSGVVVNVPPGIKLPVSTSMSVSTSGIIVQVSPEKIWVDDELVLDVSDISRTTYDYGGRRIVPLFDELIRKRDIIKQVQKSSPDAKKFSGRINLIVDKSLKYSYIKKLMFTCAEAGFRQYKFVVLGENY